MTPIFETVVAYFAAFGLISLAFLIFETLAGSSRATLTVWPRADGHGIEQMACYIERCGIDGPLWVVADETDEHLRRLFDAVTRMGGRYGVVTPEETVLQCRKRSRTDGHGGNPD